MPWLVSGVSNSGKYSRPLPSLWPKAAETARSTPLANRRPALARVVRVPSIPTSTVTTPPSIDAPVLVITLTTAKKALSPYWEEAGPRMISTRSNVDGSMPELGADLRLPEHVVIDPVAVDQEQDPAVVVAGLAEAAGSDQAEVAIVGHVETSHPTQDLGERAVAVPPDVFGGDERYRRGRLGDRLEAL